MKRLLVCSLLCVTTMAHAGMMSHIVAGGAGYMLGKDNCQSQQVQCPVCPPPPTTQTVVDPYKDCKLSKLADGRTVLICPVATLKEK